MTGIVICPHLAQYLLFEVVPIGICVTASPLKEEFSNQPWKANPLLIGVGKVRGNWVALNEVNVPEGLDPLFNV